MIKKPIIRVLILVLIPIIAFVGYTAYMLNKTYDVIPSDKSLTFIFAEPISHHLKVSLTFADAYDTLTFIEHKSQTPNIFVWKLGKTNLSEVSDIKIQPVNNFNKVATINYNTIPAGKFELSSKINRKWANKINIAYLGNSECVFYSDSNTVFYEIHSGKVILTNEKNKPLIHLIAKKPNFTFKLVIKLVDGYTYLILFDDRDKKMHEFFDIYF